MLWICKLPFATDVLLILVRFRFYLCIQLLTSLRSFKLFIHLFSFLVLVVHLFLSIPVILSYIYMEVPCENFTNGTIGISFSLFHSLLWKFVKIVIVNPIGLEPWKNFQALMWSLFSLDTGFICECLWGSIPLARTIHIVYFYNGKSSVSFIGGRRSIPLNKSMCLCKYIPLIINVLSFTCIYQLVK